jgi:hypothetical protein
MGTHVEPFSGKRANEPVACSSAGLGGEGGVAGEAVGLLQGLRGLGQEAPEDVEVVGVDGELRPGD